MVTWEKISTDFKIDAVAADIDLSMSNGSANGTLELILRFTSVVDGMRQDIAVKFDRRHVLAFRYFEESFDMKLDLGSRGVPVIGFGNFSKATFPLIRSSRSKWILEFEQEFNNHPMLSGCQHYIFLSLNDVVEVLASQDPILNLLPAML